jgi:hypothetical protein
MTQEQTDRLLNIAAVFVWNHKEEFINDYATDQMMFGTDSAKAYVDAEKAYDEIAKYITEQF